MKKIIRLTESDLTRIIKRVINESNQLNEIGEYDMDMITKYWGNVIEKVNIKGFELSLVKFPLGKTVSLTFNDKGYFKPGEQKKQPSEYDGRDIMKIFRSFKPYIIDWIDKYDSFHIGSTNKKRVEYYHKWLCDDLNCGDIKMIPGFNPGEPQYSFELKSKRSDQDI